MQVSISVYLAPCYCNKTVGGIYSTMKTCGSRASVSHAPCIAKTELICKCDLCHSNHTRTLILSSSPDLRNIKSIPGNAHIWTSYCVSLCCFSVTSLFGTILLLALAVSYYCRNCDSGLIIWFIYSTQHVLSLLKASPKSIGSICSFHYHKRHF